MVAPSDGFFCRMAERLPFLNNVMQILHIRAGDEDSDHLFEILLVNKLHFGRNKLHFLK